MNKKLKALGLLSMLLMLATVGYAQEGSTAGQATSGTSQGENTPNDLKSKAQEDEGKTNPLLSYGAYTEYVIGNSRGHFGWTIYDGRINHDSRIMASICEYWTDYHYCGYGGATNMVIDNIIPFDGGVLVFVNTNWTNNNMNLRLSLFVDP